MPDHCGKLTIVREVEMKLRHGEGEVCHVSTSYMICSRSEALNLKDEELGIRIEVCRVKIHRRCLKLAAIKGCKTCVPLVVWPVDEGSSVTESS